MAHHAHLRPKARSPPLVVPDLRQLRFNYQLFRGLVLVLTTFLFFSAIQKVPITDAQIVFFINPLLVVLNAVFVLREKFKINRLVAVMVGFAGVFLVIRTGFIEFQIETLGSLCVATAISIFIISTHALSQTELSLITMFFSAFEGSLVLLLPVDASWIIPPLSDIPFLLGVGFFMTIVQFSFSKH